MKITFLLLAVTLIMMPVCRGQQQLAQAQTTPSETTLTKPNADDSSSSKSTIDDSKGKTASSKAKTATTAKKDATKSTYLSPDKGIGPVTEIKLGTIDTSMVSKGQAFFKTQCVTCHRLDKKLIGPPIRNVTNDRPPEFIMNMILNTDVMEKKDPEVKKLISQYGTYMSVLDIKQDQARQLLEYLRWAATQPPGKE